MTRAPECPTHGRMEFVDGEWLCGRCEYLTGRVELERDDPGHDPADENRYERWLDEIGGSR